LHAASSDGSPPRASDPIVAPRAYAEAALIVPGLALVVVASMNAAVLASGFRIMG
jgi:hypothetical protein